MLVQPLTGCRVFRGAISGLVRDHDRPEPCGVIRPSLSGVGDDDEFARLSGGYGFAIA